MLKLNMKIKFYFMLCALFLILSMFTSCIGFADTIIDPIKIQFVNWDSKNKVIEVPYFTIPKVGRKIDDEIYKEIINYNKTENNKVAFLRRPWKVDEDNHIYEWTHSWRSKPLTIFNFATPINARRIIAFTYQNKYYLLAGDDNNTFKLYELGNNKKIKKLKKTEYEKIFLIEYKYFDYHYYIFKVTVK